MDGGIDNSLSSSINSNVQETATLSWVSYFRCIPRLIIFLIISAIAGELLKQNWLTWTLSMGSFLDFAYQIGYRRTVKIYLDDDGVWIYSGIMPWNKGVSGVKWRDIDEALYFTGFFSWVAKSYRISIRHRFTKSSEIALKDVKHGNVFVQKVNDNLKRKIDV